MASISNSTVSSLLALGADAMSNMYDVNITLPTIVSGSGSTIDPQNLKFRCKNFSPPVPEVETYDFSYKTVTIKKVATKITLERTFDIVFILDAEFAVYKALKKWASLSSVSATGLVTHAIGAENVSTGTVEISAMASAKVNTTGELEYDGINNSSAYVQNIGWKYKNVICTKVTEPEFAQGEASALEITATFIFGEFEDPQSDLT